MPPRVLVVLNDPDSTPGRIPEWLPEFGLTPEVVPGPELPESLAGYAGLILLGGGLMPDDDEHYPFLVRERALAEKALAGGVPALGICLGGQLLAHISGGQVVEKSGQTERGMCRLEVLPEAADDPVFGQFAGGALDMIEHHQDSITVAPPTGTVLVSTDICPVQAFRLGDVAWGLQFHPEAFPERVATWDADKLRAQGVDPDALAADAMARAPKNEAQARAVFGAWAGLVA